MTALRSPLQALAVAFRNVRLFFVAPAVARPLAGLRIGLATVLLIQAWLVRGEYLDLFSTTGIVQGDLARYFSYPGTPQVSWFLPFFAKLGIAEASGISLFCLAYVVGLVGLLLGWRTPIMSLAVWFIHWVLMNTGYTTNYGVDRYAHIFLFYLIWVPSGDAYSVDSGGFRNLKKESSRARLGLRVLQLHLAISYFASGLEKAQGEQWWNGELLWRALSLPVYKQFDFSWLSYWPSLSIAGGWLTLIFELGYIVFIWPAKTRWLWIFAMAALHFGIALFLGLSIFGAVMTLLTVTLFGISPEVLDSFWVNLPFQKLFRTSYARKLARTQCR